MNNDIGRLYSKALDGKPLENEVVIDAHMHIGKYYNFMIPSKGTDALVENAKRIGIKRMYGSSLLAIGNDAPTGNELVLTAHTQFPDIFFPYFVVKPNYPEEIDEILQQAQKHRVHQFKIHDDGNGVPYDHRSYHPLYDYADSTGAVILAHTFGETYVRSLINVASQFHSLRILLAHSGITDEDIYYTAIRSCPNIYLETCNSWAWYGLIERLVENAGADRICFGTDMPFMSPDQQIGRILGARITDSQKQQILGLNAQEIFSPEAPI